MSITIAAAIYLVTWWTVLFAVLPWGVRTQEEETLVVPGSAPSAPVQPLLMRKALVTTLISALIFIAIYWLIVHSGLTIDDVPVLSHLGRP